MGKRTNIASDQFHLIVDWWFDDHHQENKLLIPALDRIREHFQVSACSSDKGYYSKIDVDLIELFEVKAYIPKKGKLQNPSGKGSKEQPKFDLTNIKLIIVVFWKIFGNRWYTR